MKKVKSPPIKTVNPIASHPPFPPSNANLLKTLNLAPLKWNLDSSDLNTTLIKNLNKKNLNLLYPNAIIAIKKIHDIESHLEHNMIMNCVGLNDSQKVVISNTMESHIQTRKKIIKGIIPLHQKQQHQTTSNNNLSSRSLDWNEENTIFRLSTPVKISKQNCLSDNGLTTPRVVVDFENFNSGPVAYKDMTPLQRYDGLVNDLELGVKEKFESSTMDSVTKELRQFTIELQKWVYETLESPVFLHDPLDLPNTNPTTNTNNQEEKKPQKQDSQQLLQDQLLATSFSTSILPTNPDQLPPIHTTTTQPSQPRVSVDETLPPLIIETLSNSQPQQQSCDFDILLNAYKPRQVESAMNGASMKISSSFDPCPPANLVASLKNSLGIDVFTEKPGDGGGLMKVKKNVERVKRRSRNDYGSWCFPPSKWNKLLEMRQKYGVETTQKTQKKKGAARDNY